MKAVILAAGRDSRPIHVYNVYPKKVSIDVEEETYLSPRLTIGCCGI